MFSEKITSVRQLEQAAKNLISEFPEQRIYAFYGKMGAGKTTFIQAICKVLGSKDNITSPTFALINEYQGLKNFIYHFDFYRIKYLEEVFDLGYEDYFYSGNYCLIEWPEKIEPLLPDKILTVKIKVDENDARIIQAELN